MEDKNMKPTQGKEELKDGPIGPFKKPTGRKKPTPGGPVDGPIINRREPGDGS